MKRLLTTLTVLIVASLVLGACVQQVTPTAEPTQPPAPTQAPRLLRNPPKPLSRYKPRSRSWNSGLS